MSEALYKIYRDDIVGLVGLMVYNHRIEATLMNAALNEDGYAISDNPLQWRYYMNMAGEYHDWDRQYISGINSDGSPLIKITIAGASGPIEVDLTKNLIHGLNADPSISLVYAFGTDAYRQLVAKYPNSEALIFGIFFPVDIEVAVESEDGDILFIGGYERIVNGDRHYFRKSERANTVDMNYIEENEVSLIDDLETWIKNMIFRWFNRDYAIIEDLYYACFRSLTHVFAVPRIMKFRLDRCKTSEANRFHIRQYLDDFGGIGRVTDHLPLKAIHYLYRNADMLAHEAGRKSTASDLIKNFLDDCQIPLTNHRLRQDLTSIEENYLPMAYADTKDLGRVKSRAGNRSLGIEALEEKILPVAPQNIYDLERIVEEEKDAVASRYADYAPTKTLESRISLASPEPRYRFIDLLMNQWAFSVAANQYNASVVINHPITGRATAISTRNALALSYYCFSIGYHNVVPETVPDFKVSFVPKASTFTPSGYLPFPNVNGLYSLYRYVYNKDFIDRFHGTVEPTYAYSTTRAFYQDAKKVYTDLLRRDLMISTTPSAEIRNRGTELMSRYFWFDFDLNIFNGRQYAELLSFLGLDFNGLTQQQILRYYQDLIIRSLGMDTESEDAVRRKQDVAIEAMRFFSSYAVHYVYSTSAGKPLWLGTSVPRVLTKALTSYNVLENPVVATSTALATAPTVELSNRGSRLISTVTNNPYVPDMQNRVSTPKTLQVSARQTLASPSATPTTRLGVTYL